MKARLFVSDSKFLERVRTALTNAQNHAEIKALMADFGMDENKLAEGQKLYEYARSIKELFDREVIESKLSSNVYQQEFEDFQAVFKKHRDFVRIYFKEDPQIWLNLGIKGRHPRKYNEVFDRAKAFYTAAQQDPSLQQQLDQVKITSEVVTDSLAKLDYLMSVRSHFDRETGESQAVI